MAGRNRKLDSTDSTSALNDLIEAMPEGALALTKEGAIWKANARAEALFGFGKEGLRGRPVESLLPEVAAARRGEAFPDFLEKLRSGARDLASDIEGIREDGSSFPADVLFCALGDAGDISAVAVIRDGSRRRHVEQTLRESEERFRQMAASIEDVFWMTDPAKNEMLYISPGYERIWGRPCESLYALPQNWVEAIHPEDRERVMQAAITKQVAGTYDEEYRIVRSDGVIRWIADRAFPVRDPQGNVYRITGVARDITDRKSVEEERRRWNAELEKRIAERTGELERFFAVSIDMLCISNVDGYFKRLSPAFSQSLGWSVEELLARPFVEFVHPDDLSATLAEVERQVKAGEQVLQFENRYRHKDGSWRVLSWKSVPQEGGFMYAVARDITEQRRLQEELRQAKEEAEHANRAKSEFLSRMSHELRTPLNSVLGYAQLLEMQYDEPRIREATRSILKGGSHLLKMINEVLDLARIESGDHAISVEPVAVAGVLAEAVGLLQPIADGAGIQLLVASDSCEEMHVMADRQRFLQVVVNLLSNAIKYNRSGGQVRIRCMRQRNNTTRIAITDTGLGISAKDQETLFQPFQRFGDPGIEGTGLGLALSERFVRLMGGELGLEESSSSGSTFYIELREAEAAFKELSHQPDGNHVASAPVSRGGTILYIEDNLSNMRLLELLFAQWKNFSLIPAIQGMIGLELAREHKPDLILLDLHLPDIDGKQVLMRLRANPSTQEIPVVVLSADATSRQIKSLREAGAADYLTKPLDLKRLTEVLERLLP